MITAADREYLITLCEHRLRSLTNEARSRGYVESTRVVWEAVSYLKGLVERLKAEGRCEQ